MKIDLYHPQELGLVLLIIAIALAVLYYALRLTVLRKRPTVILPAKPYRTALLPFDADDEDAAPTPELLRFVLQTLPTQNNSAQRSGGRNTTPKPPTRLLLVAVLTVPRSLALDAPLPQREAEIQAVLQKLQQQATQTDAANDGDESKTSPAENVEIVTVVRRARSFVEETARYAAVEHCDLLILPDNAASATSLRLHLSDRDSTSEQSPAVQLQRRIPGEVLLLRAPRPASA